MSESPRYQVFISSTYTDLVAERQALISTLLQLRALPAGMELFPAADDEAWELIKRVIDESDYYLLVIGGRYGSIDVDGIGFTEKEYDYAVSQGKPVMAFLHGNTQELPVKNSEANPDGQVKLAEFRSKVERAKHVKFWNSAEDLAGKVALSYSIFTSNYPAVGWVRGDAGDSVETLQKLAAAQDRINALESEVETEASQPPPGADRLADGDEVLEVELGIAVVVRNLSADSRLARTQRITRTGGITWDDILSGLGPLMLDEAPEERLSDRFEQEISRVNKTFAIESSRDWLKEQSDPTQFTNPTDDTSGFHPLVKVDISSSRSDFETALLQMEALGLIARGKKKRTVSDRQTYWTLTSWGRTRLTQLRAVRKGASRPENEIEG